MVRVTGLDWNSFHVGFWHPFGPYAGQDVAEILKVKRCEVEQAGWTLWSFAYSDSATVWMDVLRDSPGPFFVLCSDSQGATDPDEFGGERVGVHYSWLGEGSWSPTPAGIKVTNPFRRGGRALAFKVTKVTEIVPSVTPPFTIEWYARQDRRWRSDALPTRGEYVIRRDGPAKLRKVRAVLDLAAPYLAVVADNTYDLDSSQSELELASSVVATTRRV